MNNLVMYLCDECGFSSQRPGMCQYCQTPLTVYTKELQHEYQIDMEEPMRMMSDRRWYL